MGLALCSAPEDRNEGLGNPGERNQAANAADNGALSANASIRGLGPDEQESAASTADNGALSNNVSFRGLDPDE